MKFITFQPNIVLEHLRNGNSYVPDANYSEKYGVLGFNPIFMCKCESTRQLLTEYLGTCTSYPQSFIVLETNRFNTISKLGWSTFLMAGDSSGILSGGVQEYVTNMIHQSEFIGGEVISTCTNENDIQNSLIDFMEDKPYNTINKYIQQGLREKIKVNLSGAPIEIQHKFMKTIEKINFNPTAATNADVDTLYRYIIPKLLKTIGKKK